MALFLGIDPGSRVTGYGLIKQLANQSHQYVASGCIRTHDAALPERLKTIFESLQHIIRTYQPDEMAIEKVFLATNADSALKLGQARGAAIVAGVSNGLSVAEYSARQIKQSVVGYGGADKNQMQQMITQLLHLNKKPPSDAADALGVAFCHMHMRNQLVKMDGVRNTVRGRWR
jgi:crossover junction endodeoxyribonuclease RuvC|tara:strand:- start:2830 stop:3351 length:522 start_codon:yes stop_codon:yes gene_type:complete